MLRSSITSGHADKVPIIEMGKIINVDTANWIVDAVGDYSGRIYQDIQVACPYAHYNNGEGIYVMPEIGAVCVIASMSDSSPPVILAFGAALEEMFVDEGGTATTDELEDEELEDAPESPKEESGPAFSFRNGRPLMRPGDFCMRTRDGNFIFLRRGGVVQVGSNPMTQTIFMPIRNLIRTFAENYELELMGGSARWEVVQEEDGSSSCINTFTWREIAEDATVSAMMQVGDLDDNFLRFRMLMQGINAKTGEMTESPVIELTFTKEGDIALACKNYTKTVEEDQTIEVGGTEKETYGKLEREVKGQQTLKFKTESREGETSKEKLKSKLIEADSVILGGSAGAQPVLMGNNTLIFLLTHTHPPSGGPSTTVLNNPLSTKVKVGT